MYPIAAFLREMTLRLFRHVQLRDKNITDGGRWKAKSRQNKAEMARPCETGHGWQETRCQLRWPKGKYWHVSIQPSTLLSVETER